MNDYLKQCAKMDAIATKDGIYRDPEDSTFVIVRHNGVTIRIKEDAYISAVKRVKELRGIQ